MKRLFLLNILVIAIVISGLYLIIKKGEKLPVKASQSQTQVVLPEKDISKVAVPINGMSQALVQFEENASHPLSLLLMQILLIIIASRIFSFILTLIGQPSVVGEILAGIFLGPSAMGLLFPGFFHFIFPDNSLGTLQFLSQIGLAFFMFIIGMELDLTIIRSKARDALFVSNVSIAIPFLLGVGLAYYLYGTYAPSGIGFLAFCLFIGISLSITAFPVLARILQERGMTKTPVGSMAIICAATNDVIGWCILAAVIAIAKAGAIASSLFTIILSMLFVTLMIRGVKPLLAKLFSKQVNNEDPGKLTVALSFLTLLCSAYIAELIGIHALFGAFLAGVIMPQNNNFKLKITEKLEDVSLLVLLPIFFAFTGLRTQIGLLNDSQAWTTFALVLLVAVGGKFGGSMFASKFAGQSWKNSIMLGALMNTRGLMELIVLNIGYDLGILSPQIFAMMVLMALATTLMTGPCLNLIEWISLQREVARHRSL
ncbi:MAG TPA: cation:proton antiporter [Bacteroidia bacterium]|jgi:Kef-type K+ transport system membrane component KefB|nr:cation:proton antiporter [Bacteroidia bacterium]